MSTNHSGNVEPSVDLEEHRSVNGVNAKAVIPYSIDTSGNANPGIADTLTQAIYDALLLLQPLQNALPYSRDINDQLRVNIATGSSTINGITWANNGTYAAYYATGGPNSLDPREQLELQSQANINTAVNRWTIT